jgi:hypothetical protein
VLSSKNRRKSLPKFYVKKVHKHSACICKACIRGFSSNKPGIKTKLEIKQEAPKMITLRGTVWYKKFEGGFWG